MDRTKVRVEKIDCAEIEKIDGILKNIWAAGSAAKSKTIFEYPWDREEAHCGLIMVDGDRTVGFLGMIFSRRKLGDRVEKFCNLTSWYVHEDYRSRGIAMILPLHAMKDYTITDLTPAKNVYTIQNKLGFKDLDAAGRLLLPFGRRFFQAGYDATVLTHDKAAIETRLKGQDFTIFNDHRHYQCEHFLLAGQDRYCYIIYTKLKRKRWPYVHLHYISDPELFETTYRDIRKSILGHAKAYFVLIDSRMVKNQKLPLSICLPYRAPKQYRSATLKPAQIDNLYSELVMLNLRTHPRFKYLLRNIWRRISKR
jgi:GNAT superfamily N-acetyltransferase